MTVCIAVIADSLSGSPKIVFAADRLISAGVFFESGVSKVKRLADYAWVMVSTNDGLASDTMIIKLQKFVNEFLERGKIITIEQIVEQLSKECEKRLSAEREKEILSPYGLTYSEFIEKSLKMPEDLVKKININLNSFQYDFSAEFLVIGIDTNPHIYIVNEHGDCASSDLESFAIIGSGKFLAFPELTKYQHNPTVPLTDAIVRVYTSKKVAERIGGVGKLTDIGVLWVDKDKRVLHWELSDDDKKFLDGKIEDMRKQEGETIAGFTNEMFKWFTRDIAKKESNQQT